MAFLANFRWQDCKEPPNRSANNGDTMEKAKRDVVSLGYLSHYRETELLKIVKANNTEFYLSSFRKKINISRRFFYIFKNKFIIY